jgi:hypothetical protein
VTLLSSPSNSSGSDMDDSGQTSFTASADQEESEAPSNSNITRRKKRRIKVKMRQRELRYLQELQSRLLEERKLQEETPSEKWIQKNFLAFGGGLHVPELVVDSKYNKRNKLKAEAYRIKMATLAKEYAEQVIRIYEQQRANRIKDIPMRVHDFIAMKEFRDVRDWDSPEGHR